MKRLVPALLAFAMLGGAASADAPVPACSIDGLAWRSDPVFQAARHPAIRHQRIDAILCRSEQVFTLRHAGADFTISRSKVYAFSSSSLDGIGAQEPVNLVSVSRKIGGAEAVVGRFFVPYDISRDVPTFAPAIAGDADNTVLTLAPGLETAYRIETGGLKPFRTTAWIEQAEKSIPRDARAGRLLDVDFARLEGRLAFFRSNADDPASPGSVSERGTVLVVKLAWQDGALGLAANEQAWFERREAMMDASDAAIASEEDRAFVGRRGQLPAGAEPCDLRGWSIDADPRGMNVRAAPSAQARVLGQVPPARRVPAHEALGDEPVRSEFTIAGFQAGWFLIEKIQAPGVAYGESYPAHLPRPFAGRGWVSARLVGGAYANGGLPTGRLYLAPHEDAASREALDESGRPLSVDGSPRRILACSGPWVLIETQTGMRGWWRGLCSNQVTNCS
ncbi:MAG: hypothetical protein ACRCVA_28415 [Phreatobacter sp.]